MVHAFATLLMSTLVVTSMAFPMHKGTDQVAYDAGQSLEATHAPPNTAQLTRSQHDHTTKKELLDLNQEPSSTWAFQQRLSHHGDKGASKQIDPGLKGEEKVQDLKVRIINSKTGLEEMHDPRKHLSFPTDLREEQEQEAFRKLRESSNEQGLSEQEHNIREHNLAIMYKGGRHMANNKEGVIFDQKENVYSHHLDKDQALQRFKEGHAKKLITSNFGSSHILPSMHEMKHALPSRLIHH